MSTTTTTLAATEEAILKLTLAYDKEIHEEVSLSPSTYYLGIKPLLTPNYHPPTSTNTRPTSPSTTKRPPSPPFSPSSSTTAGSSPTRRS